MKLKIQGLPSELFSKILNGGPDANGQPAAKRKAEGLANPCRHCLQLIAEGEEMLVLSYRPFAERQPYAETGPIFLHNRECRRYDSDTLPPWFVHLQPAIVRGYDKDHWIRYETGNVVAGAELADECARILKGEHVAYMHIRSKFNCFQCRVERA